MYSESVSEEGAFYTLEALCRVEGIDVIFTKASKKAVRLYQTVAPRSPSAYLNLKFSALIWYSNYYVDLMTNACIRQIYEIFFPGFYIIQFLLFLKMCQIFQPNFFFSFLLKGQLYIFKKSEMENIIYKVMKKMGTFLSFGISWKYTLAWQIADILFSFFFSFSFLK